MKALYYDAQRMDIAFAIDDNSNLVAYNSWGIEDCDTGHIFGQNKDGYECTDMNVMEPLFPVWDYDTLYLLRKENNETILEL